MGCGGEVLWSGFLSERSKVIQSKAPEQGSGARLGSGADSGAGFQSVPQHFRSEVPERGSGVQ